MSALIDQLKFEEGYRDKPYLCTKGKKTIGYGHNMDAKPFFEGKKIPDKIDKVYAERLLMSDISEVRETLSKRFPEIEALEDARRDALIQMGFQLGYDGFMKFRKMIAAIKKRDWKEAYRQALDSDWAKQTPKRAERVSKQLLTNTYYQV